jgi:hypothetical protein
MAARLSALGEGRLAPVLTVGQAPRALARDGSSVMLAPQCRYRVISNASLQIPTPSQRGSATGRLGVVFVVGAASPAGRKPDPAFGCRVIRGCGLHQAGVQCEAAQLDEPV